MATFVPAGDDLEVHLGRVSRHANCVAIDHRHDGVPRTNEGPRIDRPLRYLAVERRAHDAVVDVERAAGQVGPLRLHPRGLGVALGGLLLGFVRARRNRRLGAPWFGSPRARSPAVGHRAPGHGRRLLSWRRWPPDSRASPGFRPSWLSRPGARARCPRRRRRAVVRRWPNPGLQRPDVGTGRTVHRPFGTHHRDRLGPRGERNLVGARIGTPDHQSPPTITIAIAEAPITRGNFDFR